MPEMVSQTLERRSRDLADDAIAVGGNNCHSDSPNPAEYRMEGLTTLAGEHADR